MAWDHQGLIRFTMLACANAQSKLAVWKGRRGGVDGAKRTPMAVPMAGPDAACKLARRLHVSRRFQFQLPHLNMKGGP